MTNMKALRKLLYIIPFMGMLATACTDVENLDFEHIGGYNTMENAESEAYYANLRAWKAAAVNNARPVTFGWFSNWTPTGAMRKGYLSSMPDSMDIVSMWSGAPDRFTITEAQKKDKEFAQKVKGLKLLEVSLLSHLGKGRTPNSIYREVEQKAEAEGWTINQLDKAKVLVRWDYWGFSSHDLANTEELQASLARYAKALCDSLVVNEWDGFDIDWEPGNGFDDEDGTLHNYNAKPGHENDNIIFLVREMGKYIGPKSDPEGKGHKLLCIDGHIGDFPGELDEYIDYWIKQSYGNPSPSLSSPGGKPEKTIITDNFESSASDGGVLLRQAAYMPSEGYKGGVGAYRFDNDYDNHPDYKYLRQAIQINQQVFNEWKAKQKK